jgi:hypothetical protein
MKRNLAMKAGYLRRIPWPRSYLLGTTSSMVLRSRHIGERGDPDLLLIPSE